jgi:hypothetical protein
MPFTLWPPYERMRLMPHELAWARGHPLAKDVWWARWILKNIGKHDRAWVPIARLQRDSEVYVGKQLDADAFRVAAQRSGARVREDAVGYDMRACDHMLWDTVEREL